jgi:hypothetical protein
MLRQGEHIAESQRLSALPPRLAVLAFSVKRCWMSPMLKHFLRPWCCAVGIAAVLATGAWAEEQYSDAQLQAFLTAAIKVDRVIQDWAPKIRAAQSPEEQKQLVQSVRTEVIQAIQSTNGMTLEEYTAITERVTNDPQLAQRLERILRGQPSK